MNPLKLSRTVNGFPIERVTGCLPVIDTNHAQIHAGNAFSLSGELTVAAGTVGGIEIAVPGDVKASLAINMTNALADLTYTAVTSGSRGNSITVAHINPAANNQTLAVTVVSEAITISLATGAGGAITSTAAQVAAAVNAHASLLVTASAEGNGSGIVNAVAATNLAGGSNPAYVHFQALSFQANGGPASVSLLDDYWFDAATAVVASPFSPKNHHRIGKSPSALTVKGWPLVTLETGAGELAGETLVTMPIYGAVTGQQRVSANAGQSEEWVLKPGNKAVVAFSNAHSGPLKFGYMLFWYEESAA
jgi:hypothetical protein